MFDLVKLFRSHFGSSGTAVVILEQSDVLCLIDEDS